MAEDTGIDTDEAAELERLLEGGEGEEAGEEAAKKFSFSKKAMIITGAGAMVFLAVVGTGAYFLLGSEEAVEEALVEETLPEVTDETEKEITKGKIAKVNIYPLESFFLPIRADQAETGKFLIVKPNLLLSNSALNKGIDTVLPLIRKNIFTLLKRKSLKDLSIKKIQTQERIKMEILATANALLLGGTGTVKDVYFTQFIIR